MNKTIDYYNTNAADFFTSTVNADMSAQYKVFEKYLHPGASVLDCGCGSGRDTKYFLEKGYKVTAIDGSEELCKKASELTGINVRNLYFQNLDYVNEFDGVWACASLLHVDIKELPDVLLKLCRSLKEGGILYVSFKYGDFSGERNGRMFTDLSDESFGRMIEDIPEFSIVERGLSYDVRPGREEEKWLNAIVVKK